MKPSRLAVKNACLGEVFHPFLAKRKRERRELQRGSTISAPLPFLIDLAPVDQHAQPVRRLGQVRDFALSPTSLW
jgi:hypothetical protein